MTLRATAPSGTPDPYIATYAESTREACRQSLAWSADNLRLDLGLAEIATDDEPGRMVLCHRPCADYAHFHWIKDRA